MNLSPELKQHAIAVFVEAQKKYPHVDHDRLADAVAAVLAEAVKDMAEKSMSEAEVRDFVQVVYRRLEAKLAS